MRLIQLTLTCILAFSFSLAVATPTQRYQLDNGLTLLVKEDHRAPVAVFMVWYKIGSAYELPGLTGISHMLEHMMFKGTKEVPGAELMKIISENGGEGNASTSRDYTNYYQELASDRIELSFQLEADRMQNLIVDDKEFTKEMQVVQEERYMRTDDDPQNLTFERFMAAAHLASPYHHPIIGWMSDLKNMTRDDVERWYKTWYTPNNATVVIIGDVKPEVMLQLAKKYFGSIPSHSVPKLKPQPEPPGLGLRQVAVAAPAKLPLLIMGYNAPSLKTTNTAWHAYALLVAAAILDSGESARIRHDVIRGKQIASEAGVDYSPFGLFSQVFILEGTPAKGHSIEELKTALLDQIKTLQTQPVTAEELTRVKRQVMAQRIFENDSLLNQGYKIGMLESIGLPPEVDTDYEKNIAAVTVEQVQQVAKLYFDEKYLTVAELKPLPTTDTKESTPFSVGAHNVH